MLFLAIPRSFARIGIGMDFHGRAIYSFAEWTVGTYCWAAVALLSAGVFLAASVFFLVGLSGGGESKQHGFPIR